MTVDPRAPQRAPARRDLTWLRHRNRASAAVPVAAAAPAGSGTSALADFVAGRSTARRPAPAVPPRPSAPVPRPAAAAAPRPVPPAASSSLDLSAPAPVGPAAPAGPPSGGSLDLFGPSADPPAASAATPAPAAGSTSLDLGAPPAAPPRPATTPSGSTSLDLGAAPLRPPPSGSPAAAPSGPPSGATSLDLGGPVGAPALPSTTAPPGLRRPVSTWVEPRVTAGVPLTLTPRRPTVTLNRLQSGVGTLTFEAVITAAAGDLRLGTAYQLRSGRASTVQHQLGRRYAPPGETRRPILVASRQEYERIAVDLRQVTDLERFIVYAFSGNGQMLQWAGTLIATTFGGDRIEMPIELAPAPAVAVLASVYNLGGELVVRSEMDLIAPNVREACRGYGFDRISWIDDATPID